MKAIELELQDRSLNDEMLKSRIIANGWLRMQLEDYFNFLAADDIRLKGTRIGIETILFDHLFRAKTPEEIAKTYPSLELEQVYATILYYLHNKQAVEAYLQDWLEWGDRMREEQKRNPNPVVEKLKKLKAQKLPI